MDKYSRLLVHLSTVNCNKTEDNLYTNILSDLSVFDSPNEELAKIIKDDLPTILPAILILSLHDDVKIRIAITRTFDTFHSILDKNPSVKSESWWKDMEDKLIAKQFSAKLVKMVEMDIIPWENNWAFVAKLVVNNEHVYSVAINSLLKVVERAFKMSKKNDAIIVKAYYCWNQLIDVFAKYQKAMCSQKLIELLVRPLSATHLSLKCPDLKIETWCHLLRKIGFSVGGNKCRHVVEPFIDYMYLKGEDSLCVNFSKKCMEAYAEIIAQKKIYKSVALKVISAFTACYENCTSEELEPTLIKIWTGILDNIPLVDENNRNEYVLEIFTRFHQAIQTEKPELNNKLMRILVDRELFNIDNLRTCIMSELSLVSIFSDFMKFKDFRNVSFSLTVKDLVDNFSESNSKKPQNNVNLQIWDVLCEIYAFWVKNMSGPLESDTVDKESLCSLLMIPFINKQWSVAVQKTWYSVVDSVHSTETGENTFLPFLLEKINDCLKESHITAALCIEICTHIVNKDKGAYKTVMPTLVASSSFLPPKDSKPLLDMLVILENAVSHVSKTDLSKFLNELMIYGNKYEHPYGLRIRTKISKVQRKVFQSDAKEQENVQQSKTTESNEQPNGCKSRSPIMAQSSFLQRLAKAEEKKKKKVPSIVSIFGDAAAANQSHRVSSPDQNEEGEERAESPNEDKVPEGYTEHKDALEVPAVNGRCSPALPNIVNIVTPSKLKRSQTKSPEPITASNDTNKKPASMKMPPPPTYFEDDAQDFVVVPPKPKTTPLTEHQKEMLSKRRSDIPALYQDLSQDTFSDSQSLKEIVMLKCNNSTVGTNNIHKPESELEVQKPECSVNEIESKEERKEITDQKTEDSSNENGLLLPKTDKKESAVEEKCVELEKSDSVVKNSKSGSAADGSESCEPETITKSEVSKSSPEEEEVVDNVCNTDETPSQDIDSTGVSETSKDLKLKDISKVEPAKDSIRLEQEIGVREPSSGNLEDSEEIIESTPHFEPAVSLNLTPTKQPGPPTPRNLIRRMNLLDQEESPDNKKAKFIEDEEIGKENIIYSTMNAEKTPTNITKRRSLRKSCNSKFITKKHDEVKEGNVKSELTDALKDVTEGSELKESKLNSKTDSAQVLEGPKTILDLINNKKEINTAVRPKLVVMGHSENSNQLPSDNGGEVLENSEEGKMLSEKIESEETKELSQNDESKLQEKQLCTDDAKSADDGMENKTCDDDAKEELTEDKLQMRSEHPKLEQNLANDIAISKNETDFNKSFKLISDEVGSSVTDAKDVSILEKNSDESVLEQTDAESPSADVSNWAMTTPAKRGRKPKKLKEEENKIKVLSPQFSPKLLRSKRLSLTKNQEAPEQSKKKPRKSAPMTKENKDDDKNNLEKAVATGKAAGNTSKESDSESNDEVPTADSNVTPIGSVTPVGNRKRKSQEENSLEVEGKKKKIDMGTDDINQDSLLVVKNNIVKPRKKKIIKSNVKCSPNNLEQWLIKSGKTIVKTSLISQENTSNESETKVIDESTNVQINITESTKPVEASPKESLTPAKESPRLENPDIVVIEPSPEANSDSDDLHNCTVMDESSFSLNISTSEDESVIKANESKNESPLKNLQSNEPEVLVPTSDDSFENTERRVYRRRRRLLKKEETPLRECVLSPDDETFDAKKERLTTPYRSSLVKSGRSAQMVKMATGDEEQEQQNHTPVRRRSISALRLTDNWPEGRLEDWVPCMPTPPGVPNPSPGILRRRPVLSPTSSPTASPSLKKKRVSFLDPPVSKGLLYCKAETLGQVQHADIPPGMRPVWKDEEEVDLERPGPSGIMNNTPVDGGFGAAEGEDELTAIQEFLNSTPDAPWSKAIPPELDMKNIAGLDSCTNSVEELLTHLTDGEEERSALLEEFKKLNVITIYDLCSINLTDLNKLSKTFTKMNSLASIIEKYIKEKESSLSVIKEEPMEETKTAEKEINADNAMDVEENVLTIEEVKTVEFNCQSVQTEPAIVTSITSDDESVAGGSKENPKMEVSGLMQDSEFRISMAEHIPQLLSDKEVLGRLPLPQLVDSLAGFADYSFIARLCMAIESQKGKPA